MRKQTLTALGLGLVGIAATPAVPAQNLEMAAAPAAATAAGMPSRGQSMAQVERQYGAPSERLAAVGQPPITRWLYPDMLVVFEHEHVVHTVALRR